jgi:chemotaxis protein CheD
MPHPSPRIEGLLQALKRRPQCEQEASFFFYDPSFDRAAAKVLPGEFYVSDQDIVITTTLGSCVAACLRDPGTGVAGMNHFMLPDGRDGRDGADAGASGRFGAFAMELLINEMIKRGARRGHLEAKIFGGGQVMKSLASTSIGEQNVAFVQGFLARERIPVLASDVLGLWPRRICLFPADGRVLCRRLPATHGEEFELQEERYRARLVQQPRAGAMELFA